MNRRVINKTTSAVIPGDNDTHDATFGFSHKTAEELLIGKEPTEELFAEAAQEVAQEMIRRTGVRWSTAYKEPALIAVVQQTLQQAWESAT